MYFALLFSSYSNCILFLSVVSLFTVNIYCSLRFPSSFSFTFNVVPVCSPLLLFPNIIIFRILFVRQLSHYLLAVFPVSLFTLDISMLPSPSFFILFVFVCSSLLAFSSSPSGPASSRAVLSLSLCLSRFPSFLYSPSPSSSFRASHVSHLLVFLCCDFLCVLSRVSFSLAFRVPFCHYPLPVFFFFFPLFFICKVLVFFCSMYFQFII